MKLARLAEVLNINLPLALSFLDLSEALIVQNVSGSVWKTKSSSILRRPVYEGPAGSGFEVNLQRFLALVLGSSVNSISTRRPPFSEEKKNQGGSHFTL